MQHIEDAVTAKGIKFIKKNRSYDWLAGPKVVDYVFELTGVQRNWRTVYYWMHRGLLGSDGKKVYLRYIARGKKKFMVRKLWVREFLDNIRKGG
jgi:hypothetical protein